MTPQERHLIDDLFDRLAGLENAPRDAEAERAIIAGLRRAPNAAYALVQTTLLQDEALKRANARIEELEGDARPQSVPQPASFLDSMRDAVFGPSSARGSVPSVGTSRPVWNSGAVLNGAAGDPRAAGYAPQASGYGGPGYPAPAGGGSSFLGTAAAAAVGAIGGSMLMNSIHGLMGGHQAFGNTSAFGSSPWSNNAPGKDLSGSDLARDAGINDIGRTSDAGPSQSQGFFDNASNDVDDDDGFDGDSGDGGDSDFA